MTEGPVGPSRREMAKSRQKMAAKTVNTLTTRSMTIRYLGTSRNLRIFMKSMPKKTIDVEKKVKYFQNSIFSLDQYYIQIITSFLKVIVFSCCCPVLLSRLILTTASPTIIVVVARIHNLIYHVISNKYHSINIFLYSFFLIEFSKKVKVVSIFCWVNLLVFSFKKCILLFINFSSKNKNKSTLKKLETKT
jgi:hypothetical protein